MVCFYVTIRWWNVTFIPMLCREISSTDNWDIVTGFRGSNTRDCGGITMIKFFTGASPSQPHQVKGPQIVNIKNIWNVFEVRKYLFCLLDNLLLHLQLFLVCYFQLSVYKLNEVEIKSSKNTVKLIMKSTFVQHAKVAIKVSSISYRMFRKPCRGCNINSTILHQ